VKIFAAGLMDRGARRHPLLEFDRKTVQGRLWHAHALSPSNVNAKIPNQPGVDGTHHSSAGAT
jgi:hypothetical protein